MFKRLYMDEKMSVPEQPEVNDKSYVSDASRCSCRAYFEQTMPLIDAGQAA